MCGGRAFKIIQSNQEAIPSALGTCFIIGKNFKRIALGVLKLFPKNKTQRKKKKKKKKPKP